MSATITRLMLAEQQRAFDATAIESGGMLTIHLSVADADRWLKLYDTEWQQIVNAVTAAKAGGRTSWKPECARCGLRIRPAADNGWRHWSSNAGRRADADHRAELDGVT